MFSTKNYVEGWIDSCDERARVLIKNLHGDVFSGDVDMTDDITEWTVGFTVDERLTAKQIRTIMSTNPDISINEEENEENEDDENEDEEDEESE